MFRYYAIRAEIGYYSNPPARAEVEKGGVVVEDGPPAQTAFSVGRWREPPHVGLANLRDDPQALLAFTRRYGVVSAGRASGVRFVALRDELRFRDYLRKAWEGNKQALDQMRVDVSARLRTEPSGLEIEITDLWTLIRLLFLQDNLSGRTKVCRSPQCPAPYFLAARKGQKFCSHKCAVLINVQKFRERQAKPRKQRKPQARKSGGRAKR